MRTLGVQALDVLYPRQCVLCHRGGAFLCERCVEAMPLADGDRCDRCWKPVWDEWCRRCIEEPIAVSQVRSVFRYEGEARRLVHAFKFRYLSALSESMAAPMIALASAYEIDVDAIVPTPLSSGREKERGFNQALLLARHIGKALDIPVSMALRRTRTGRSQVQSVSAEERWRNVDGAFALARGMDVADQRLLLIDDVATTCATLDACARVLLDAGAVEVSALTFARED